jgi:hypothetical protein
LQEIVHPLTADICRPDPALCLLFFRQEGN